MPYTLNWRNEIIKLSSHSKLTVDCLYPTCFKMRDLWQSIFLVTSLYEAKNNELLCAESKSRYLFAGTIANCKEKAKLEFRILRYVGYIPNVLQDAKLKSLKLIDIAYVLKCGLVQIYSKILPSQSYSQDYRIY